MATREKETSGSESGPLGGLEQRSRVLAGLGRRLSTAESTRQAGEIILETADELMGWDCCAFNLYYPEMDTVTCVLAFDLLEGQRQSIQDIERDVTPSETMRKVLRDGAQLVLREGPLEAQPGLDRFGDKGRLSASLMFVPVRSGQRGTGMLTIQSYSPQAYDENDLALLQALADHLGGALERIQIQGLLRRTEELYRRAIGGVGAVPYVYDYRTRSYSFIGDDIEQLTGYSAKEINGDVWRSIIRESAMAGEAAGLAKDEAARRVKTGELRHWRCDMRIVTKDGKSRWISDASVQNLDESGRAIGSMGILEDITERKQAELSALALSELSQSLISATTTEEVARTLTRVADKLFPWDAYGFYLYLPHTGETRSLLFIDTVDGRRREVPAPEEPRGLGAAPRHPLERGAELILREADGLQLNPAGIPFGDKQRPSASIMRVPVHLRANQATGVVAFHSYALRAYTQRDLKTLQSLADCCGVALERIWADEALRQSESEFRLVWESTADGMRLTNQDGVMLRVNEAFCRMVEKPRAELEGRPLSVIQDPALAAFIQKAFQQRLEANTIQPHFEIEITLWNGKRVWFELSNCLLRLPGKPPLLLSIFRNITQRKQAEAEIERMNRQLMDVSRQAGMAEVATSVLHNVGNVLNSVNISSALISGKLKNSKLVNLGKAVALMQAHESDLAGFLSQDPKGKQLPAYLKGLAEHLAGEQKEMLEEMKSLSGNIEHINEIVAMQQSYAKVLGVLESLPMADLVEDALRLNAGAMERHQVRVFREFSDIPPMLIDKHKVLQILINLIRNAKYALDDGGREDKRLTIRLEPAPDKKVRIIVRDNGVGIPPENLTRIFEHGFTTRKKGHGFGLHNGALAAKELGGSLTAQSEGPGKGAAFILELPFRSKDGEAETGAAS